LLEQSGNDLFCCQERNMFDNHVTYHIHQATLLPPNDAQAYQYILAANGLFVRAETRFWQACILVAACEVRGLQPLQSWFGLKIGRLPATLLTAVIGDARQQRRDGGGLNEALYQFRHDGHQVRLVRPAQQATASRVQTRQPPPPDMILEIHSHGATPAYWSATDNRDEQGACLYGVMGRLDGRPQVRLRVGVYGYWQELPLTAVFGDKERK
jgi:PRTRC genetic system protein A